MFRFRVAFSKEESGLYETYDEMIEGIKKELKVEEFDSLVHNELSFERYGEFVVSDCDRVVDVVGYFWWEEKDEA